jgi:diaminopimelate epimerase
MNLSFTKMHGLGNDFIVVSELDGVVVDEEEKPGFARTFCERRLSVGADGVLFLLPSDSCDLRMRIFNPDGIEAENCVNGLRCAGLKYNLISGNTSMCIDTKGGPVRISIHRKGEGKAIAEIEVGGKREYEGKADIKVDGGSYQYHRVDIGNPHAVIFLDEDVSGFPVREIGKSVEEHERFSPGRTNVEFVNIKSKTALKMRVWERGVGETMSCGTGSIAAVIAACEKGKCRRDDWVRVEQPGGDLEIKYGDVLRLKGPAAVSYEGRLSHEK